MFDPQAPSNNNSSQINSGLPNTKTPPPLPPQAGLTEPEDIFKNVDPAPVASPRDSSFLNEPASLRNEPIIKNAPSIFNSVPSPKNIPPVSPAMVDVTAPSKTLDAKSIILLIIIAVIIIGTVAAAIWWFLGYQKNKNINANNSPAVNLFNSLNNAPVVNNNTDNPSTNTNVNADTNTNVNAVAPSSTLPAASPDTDGDGLTDEEEATLGTTINAADTDNDDLSDREEVKIYKTDPLKADTDTDGYPDGDEVKAQKDPLKADIILETGIYTNSFYKFSFSPLAGMTFSSAADNVVLFNDDVNQVKFYIYVDGSEPADLALPDFSYLIAVGSDGLVYIKNSDKLADQTPYSTEYGTVNYEAANGHRYVIRYIATKRADTHQANFETMLKSFNFLP